LGFGRIFVWGTSRLKHDKHRRSTSYQVTLTTGDAIGSTNAPSTPSAWVPLPNMRTTGRVRGVCGVLALGAGAGEEKAGTA
jgi:hypothetical protein